MGRTPPSSVSRRVWPRHLARAHRSDIAYIDSRTVQPGCDIQAVISSWTYRVLKLFELSFVLKFDSRPCTAHCRGMCPSVNFYYKKKISYICKILFCNMIVSRNNIKIKLGTHRFILLNKLVYKYFTLGECRVCARAKDGLHLCN